MKPLQPHAERDEHILVNLADPEGGAMGTMYIRPADLREITRKTSKFTEVKYGKQRLRLFEPADKVQAIIDAHQEAASE